MPQIRHAERKNCWKVGTIIALSKLKEINDSSFIGKIITTGNLTTPRLPVCVSVSNKRGGRFLFSPFRPPPP